MLKVEVFGHLSAKQRLEYLKLPGAKRKRILRGLVNHVRKESRKRLRSQTDLKGKKWDPRKGKSKRKMLTKVGRYIATTASSETGKAYFRNGIVGRIASEHQHGIDTIMTSQKMQQIHGQPDYDAPATHKQARALRDEGFKIRRARGRGYKKASLKWIKENLQLGQAGIILREMRDMENKRRWTISLPKRSFLGTDDSDLKEMIQEIFNSTIKAEA